jgi:hypothetical protein
MRASDDRTGTHAYSCLHLTATFHQVDIVKAVKKKMIYKAAGIIRWRLRNRQA